MTSVRCVLAATPMPPFVQLASRYMSLDDDALGELLDEVGIGLDLNAAGSTLEPLVGALIDNDPAPAIRQQADRAVEELWDYELQAEVRAELTAFRDESPGQDSLVLATVDTALAELGRPASENHVAHALIWRATAELVRRANRNYRRVAEIEDELLHAPPNLHRRLTLPIAVTATLAADIDDDQEVAAAIGKHLVPIASLPSVSRKRSQRAIAGLARSLATAQRRQDMRAGLGELSAMSADQFPRVAAALGDLLAEPVPTDPAEDELWVSLVVGLAEEMLEEAGRDHQMLSSVGPRSAGE